MKYVSFEVSLIVLLPAIALCVYVYIKDQAEKEPIGLLATLFGAGAVAFIPAYYSEKLVTGGIDLLFEKYMQFSAEGALSYSSFGTELAHNALCAFFGFSLVEICIKWLILYLFTRKNPHFNYLFDGIVYSVFISIGFVAIENIQFAWVNGWETLGIKVLSSLPCHLFIGILMGYYYTMWHVRYKANGFENQMLSAGIVEKDNVRSSAVWLIASLVIPFFVKGLYAMMSLSTMDIIHSLFYFTVFMLYGCSFITIEQMASKDCNSKRYLCRILAKGHPEIALETIENIVNNNGVKEADGK